MSRCPECVRCEGDCDGIAFCLSELGAHPCAHDRALCGECNIEHCSDCRLEAEQEMYRSGEYDPRADPFLIPKVEPAARTYWAATASWSALRAAGVFRFSRDKDAR